ncbi:MAG: hypothetical protein IJ600_12950 [Lachnospiraceae bacterium]|nr:hypothetical protein [Lachnospiraceae bacterium]
MKGKWPKAFIFLFLISATLGSIVFMSPWKGILYGLIFSVLFIIVLFLFDYFSYNKKKFQEKLPRLEEGEILLEQASANCWVSPIMLGGYLFLTNRRLYFTAHHFFQSPMEKEIFVDQINDVRTNGKINQIEVCLSNDTIIFVVDEKEKWVRCIKNCIH